jgi:2-keto-4-pentenoate hydratase/2-oxohepta-3-ene-1,7-dioic acid hydratase in catechol pathway
MKLYTFEIARQRRLGLEWDRQLIDLSAAYEVHAASLAAPPMLRVLPPDMASFIRLGTLALDAAQKVLAFVKKRPALPVGTQILYPFEAVAIQAPLRPGKILCSGLNYRGRQEENPAANLPEEPFFFSKLPSAVIGPGAAIVKPARQEQLDYEVELAVVIGKRMKAAPETAAMEHVFGYTILNDVSAREVQFKDHQITLGKNFDTFCPLGPCVVTADELTNPAAVRLRSILNGRVMQDSSTADWLFSLPRLLSFLSSVMTLEPGDVVSTGTPAGAGVFQKPPVFMKAGDAVVLEAEGIGRLENPVVAEG